MSDFGTRGFITEPGHRGDWLTYKKPVTTVHITLPNLTRTISCLFSNLAELLCTAPPTSLMKYRLELKYSYCSFAICVNLSCLVSVLYCLSNYVEVCKHLPGTRSVIFVL